MFATNEKEVEEEVKKLIDEYIDEVVEKKDPKSDFFDFADQLLQVKADYSVKVKEWNNGTWKITLKIKGRVFRLEGAFRIPLYSMDDHDGYDSKRRSFKLGFDMSLRLAL